MRRLLRHTHTVFALCGCVRAGCAVAVFGTVWLRLRVLWRFLHDAHTLAAVFWPKR